MFCFHYNSSYSAKLSSIPGYRHSQQRVTDTGVKLGYGLALILVMSVANTGVIKGLVTVL